jgi:putative ABC transport system ATP-binding protein
MSLAIQTQALSKTYLTGEASFTALAPLDLEVKRGDFVAFIGPSGSGKTTLLSLVAGLDSPTSGEVKVLGTPLNSLSPQGMTEFRRNQIGFIFQAYNLFPTLTAIENVELILLLQGKEKSEARKKAEKALNDVGLKEYAHRYPTKLSGGQQQRVAVARALASEPPILIADEPTANLDSKTAQHLIELFKELNQKGTTVLFSSHDASVYAHAKTQVFLRDGKLETIQGH